MKRLPNPVIPNYTPKVEKKVEDISLPLKPCIVCQKMTQGYGVWLEGNTCSRACESVRENQGAPP